MPASQAARFRFDANKRFHSKRQGIYHGTLYAYDSINTSPNQDAFYS